MKYSLALILLATSLTACNSGGICNPDTASKAHAKTPPASGDPLIESGSAQNDNPTTPILAAPAANESNNTPNLNPIIVTKPSESAIANNPPTVSSYKYPDGCVPVEEAAMPHDEKVHDVDPSRFISANDLETPLLPKYYIYAKCKNDQGVTPDVYSRLNLNACTPDSAIINNNGILECAQYHVVILHLHAQELPPCHPIDSSSGDVCM